MKNLPKILISLVLISVLYFQFSASVFAAGTGIWEGAECAEGGVGGPTKPCDLCDALTVTKNIINELFKLAVAIAVAVMVWGAIRLITAGGSEKNITEGKKILTMAITGLAIALASWAMVHVVIQLLSGHPNWQNWNQITC